MVVGWMVSSTDDIQLSSFSCSPPQSSSSSCSSSSSSIPGTRWSLARLVSSGCPGGSASSRFRLWAHLWRGTLTCPASCPGYAGSVCVDFSNVSVALCSVDVSLPMWPLGVVTILSDSWLDIVQRLRSRHNSHIGTDISTKHFHQSSTPLYSFSLRKMNDDYIHDWIYEFTALSAFIIPGVNRMVDPIDS